MSTLTPRERDVISALVAGHTAYKDISRALQIQKGTIRHHMASIFDKTNVRDRVALVLWALRNGWTLGDDPCPPQTCLANLARQLADDEPCNVITPIPPARTFKATITATVVRPEFHVDYEE